MKLSPPIFALSAAAVLFAAIAGLADDSKTAQDAIFESKIRPIFVAKCNSCHSGEHPMAGLKLDSADGFNKGGVSNVPLIATDKPENSLLLKVVHFDGKVKMPPAGKLSEGEIASLTAWVKSGGRFPVYAKAAPYPPTAGNFWSFQPIKKVTVPKLPLPKVSKTKKLVAKSVVANAPINPIDAFLKAKLIEKGLSFSPKADKRTLLRRVTFDLIGLPPTPEEIADFLNDKSPKAYAKVVDRLLASPHYGERWGRRWLDVARYADSNGQDENKAFAYAYRYRDYVIAATNKDTPYDQFIHEQLAGDLLPYKTDEQRNEQVTATGFLSLGAKVLAEQDKPKMVMDIVDEQIEVTSKAFLGLTVACARCHNHKFDPIPTADYYALAGIFKSTKTMADLGFVSNWNERSLPTKAIEADRSVHQQKIDVAEKHVADAREKATVELARSLGPKAKDYLLAGWEAARQPGAFSRAEQPRQPDETRIMVEAETFVRGNALRNTTDYGKGIGVIHTGSPPTEAEWDIQVPTGGNYQVEFRYTGQESRPVKLSVNGKIVREEALKNVTGSWFPEGQKWEPQGVFAFHAGKNTVRIASGGTIPHIDKFILISVNGKSSGKVETVAEIAKRHDLIPAVVQTVANSLSNPQNSPYFFPVHLVLEGQSNASGTTAVPVHFQPGLVINPYVRANFEGKSFQSPEAVLERYADLLNHQATETGADRASFESGFFEKDGVLFAKEKVEPLYPAPTLASIQTLEREADGLKKSMPMIPVVMAVDEGKVENVKIHIRGSTESLGDESQRGFVSVLLHGAKQPEIPPKSSGRMELADWIASPNNPLTSRVLVNRVWQNHFGTGLVTTPDNFGLLGARPTHPELLDWLAYQFTHDLGWSQKKLHRLILTSEAYQQSVKDDPKADLKDAGNELLWRQSRKRLEAEPFRDSLLAVAGTLDLSMGGSVLSTPDNDYVTNDQSGDAGAYTSLRRAIYLPIIRNSLYDLFLAFDFGDPSMVNAKRASTTVAPQALFIMNSPLALDQSKALAKRLLALKVATDTDRLSNAFLLLYGRPAKVPEIARLMKYADRFDELLKPGVADADKRKERVWDLLAQTLLSANEFIYID